MHLMNCCRLQNVSRRGADVERQVAFVNELKFGLIGLATLVACLRLPGFLCEVNEGLREERP